MLGVLFFPESFQKSTDEFVSFQTKPPWFLIPFFNFSSLINNKVWYVVILTIYAIMFIAVPFLTETLKGVYGKNRYFSP